MLDRLADYAEARDALRQTLLSALTYPLLLAVVAIAVVAGLLTWVVPQIIGVFENMHQTLPLATRVLMGLSDFLRHWAWLLVGLIVLGVIAIRVALRREAVRYRWHGFLLRLPLIGRLTRAANTARAARTLALLAGAAVPLLDALAIAAQVVPNLPMRESLRQAAFKVREGSGFARALAESKQFPPVALRLIAMAKNPVNCRACSRRPPRSSNVISTAGSAYSRQLSAQPLSCWSAPWSCLSSSRSCCQSSI